MLISVVFVRGQHFRKASPIELLGQFQLKFIGLLQVDGLVKFGPLAIRMEKDKKRAFSCSFAAFDMKIYSDSTPMKFQRSRSFSELVKRSFVSCQSTFSKDFPAKSTEPISI